MMGGRIGLPDVSSVEPVVQMGQCPDGGSDREAFIDLATHDLADPLLERNMENLDLSFRFIQLLCASWNAVEGEVEVDLARRVARHDPDVTEIDETASRMAGLLAYLSVGGL